MSINSKYIIMKRTLFLLISLYMGLMGANAQSNKFDLNEDGDVNITDVTKIVTKILTQNEENGYDLNDDGDVNITDVILLVNYILGLNNGNPGGGGNETNATGEAIDLGLPSGTKWASCNVGATKPEEYGGYYAWGETEVKNHYEWNTYIHCDDGSYTHCHYIGSDISGTEYDVAHVKWGGKWCMPTLDDIKELLDNCHCDSEILNDVDGKRFTSKINGNSIFLPAAAHHFNTDYFAPGKLGNYWSSTLLPFPFYISDEAYYLYFFSNGADSTHYYHRASGQSVRPVWKE